MLFKLPSSCRPFGAADRRERCYDADLDPAFDEKAKAAALLKSSATAWDHRRAKAKAKARRGVGAAVVVATPSHSLVPEFPWAQVVETTAMAVDVVVQPGGPE